MIEISDVTKSILAGTNIKYYVRAESWLADELLADNIPVASGREDVDRSLNVPDRITLEIPVRSNGYSWSPVTDTHPLAANGQRLRVEVGIGTSFGNIEWNQRGWFVIQESTTNGQTVQVEGRGLLTLIDEARLISPFQPTGTFKSTIQDLLEPALTVVFDDALTDRVVASGLNFDEDRLAALNTVLDTLPAAGSVTNEGYFYVAPATQSMTPVLTLTNGKGGTVIRATGSSTREGAYNAVVARGSTADGGVVQGVAYDSYGPKAYGGNFNALPVPLYFESPLLTTVAQCLAAARTRLANIKRNTSKSFEVEIVPHPALQVGDVVSLTTDDYSDLLCSIEQLSLPYKPNGGSQRLVVRSLQ